MYRRLLVSVCQTRHRALHSYTRESCLRSSECDRTLLIGRHANQRVFNAFGTSSVAYCEKKDETLPLKDTGVVQDGVQKEAVQMVGEKLVELQDAVETAAGRSEQRVNLEMVVGQKSETVEEIIVKTNELNQHQDVNMEVVNNIVEDKVAKQTPQQRYTTQQGTDVIPEEQIQPVKSGKEGLLQLLGAMKVDVTNKRKQKSLKVQRSSEGPARPQTEAMESTFSMFQEASGMADVSAPTARHALSAKLVAAASAAASVLPNKAKAESELLKKLRQHEAVGEAQKNGDNIGVIISDMKVGRRPNVRHKARPANPIQFDDDGRGYTHDRGITAELDGGLRRRSLFTGKRLSIFTPRFEAEADKDLARPTLWDVDFANNVAQSATQLPRNGFEEMIQWTKEGKLWQYPVDNEAGLEEESQVPFYEHVFLEKHLEEGFPRQGPIRHFMELVVSGLAKNPYYTVQQKRDHINWFRDYFKQKEEVLKESEVRLGQAPRNLINHPGMGWSRVSCEVNVQLFQMLPWSQFRAGKSGIVHVSFITGRVALCQSA
ncbi:hypothetical protein DPEC_G00234700 [Dallia pectoralis]|uniref:Uncharacterized protein n=1 Tax=Dallia pectoralis TaxID=75939 RepID=A0ACC2FY32_DALPE|nr:hypothetical protein DPEC_G00234700 [Dallia pectoralis]